MIKPSFIIKLEEERPDYGKFVIEPLEQGYGQTIGNSLRRCLLTSISGAAVTKVKIEGVQHPFSTLAGMREDIVELILNIKRIKVIYNGDKEAKLTLTAKGPGEVKAGNIKIPANVKIVNKDLVLAKLADKTSKLNMEMWVKSGYGYSLAEESKSEALGVISVDAIYTPVVKVNYKVEATRVGRRTDFDKLILEIWTKKTIKPREALEKAAKILVGFFEQVYNPVVSKEKEQVVEKREENEFLKLTVEELNLPTRIANALRRGGYPTVKDLVQAKIADLSKVKNLGVKSIDIVNKKLKEKGVSLREV
jgi:DNA-directed RNA polymerase subunit alpha